MEYWLVMKTIYDIQQKEDWDGLAKDLAQELEPGSVIALCGPLGAGKTTFVQALSRVLGVDSNPRSPTFSLMRIYKLDSKQYPEMKRLIHVDAYRFDKPTDVLSLNLEEELVEQGAILAIEWPENMDDWLKRQKQRMFSLKVELQNDSQRHVTISGQA